MIKWLQEREVTSSPSASSLDLTCGLKAYHLRQILPQSAADDIFLGFSADGCFLISYKSDFKHYVLRFWLFPPSCVEQSGILLTLFAERKFLRTGYCLSILSIPCIRFVQSLSSSSSFLLIACNNDGTGFVAAFGLMPDLDCNLCIEASSCQSPSSPKTTCSIHSHVLSLNIDISVAQTFSLDSDMAFCHVLHRNTLHFVPPCFRSFDGGYYSNNEYICEGSCFTSTGLPIGMIQVGVSSSTGHLRIAWANPDAQVKVISCSFNASPTYPSDSSFCLLPKGMSATLGICPHSAACIFSQDTLNVFLVSDSVAWPDNHSDSLPEGAERVYHQCSQNNATGGNQSKNRISPDIWVPSLLSERPCFVSCIQPTYLAMLQDIRASYLHWALISRNTGKIDNTIANLTNTVHPINQIDSPIDYTGEWNGNNSSPSSHNTSDDETEATLTSLDSRDSNSSPEDLLVHRLSGQCHTSFDLTGWEEYISPNVQTVVIGGDVSSNSNKTNEKIHQHVIVHLEEVVFDIPVNSMPNENKCTYSSPILALFIPSDEPDLLFVYHIKPDHSSLNSSSVYKTSDESSTANLIRILDLTTGNSLPIPCKNQSIYNQTSTNRISSSLLKKLTSHCPQNTKILSSQCNKRLIHELNNCFMVGRLESLKVLVDPQGGYSVYW
ncbi:unnamed protein product [Heterobilharzia americana]|nr:unnamed protein product [Heterobilharzia americana]